MKGRDKDDIRGLLDNPFHSDKLDYNQISELLPILVDEINSDNTELQLKSAVAFRKLLNNNNNKYQQTITQIINTGIASKLIQLLYTHDVPQLQVELAWALSILATGTIKQINVLVEHGAIQAFVLLLNSTTADDVLKEKAVLALGNIASDSTLRDSILNQNAFPSILNILQRTTPPVKSFLNTNATCTISNLCRGKPSPPFEIVGPALPILVKLINNIHYSNDRLLIANLCWALSYISEGSNEGIQQIIDSGVCSKLLELLGEYVDDKIKVPVLRTIANLLGGDDTQTQFMLDLKVLPHFLTGSRSYKNEFLKEVCRAVSNISARGNIDQIQQVFDENLIPELLSSLVNSNNDVKKESALAISNITNTCSQQQIKYLVEKHCFNHLCRLLDSTNDTSVINIVLKAIENILAAGKLEASETEGNSTVNPYIQFFEGSSAYGIGSINKLLHHIKEENVDNCNKVVSLLKNK